MIQQVLAHLDLRRQAGDSIAQVADDLGLAVEVRYRWRRSHALAPAPAFRSVEVVPERHGFTVHGPHGLPIEGLDLDALAELLQGLG